MSDELNSFFLQKLNALEKFARDDKNNRKAIIKEICKLIKWLLGDRSLREHHTCQLFLTYLWENFGKDFNNRNGFVSWLKCKLGFADIKITKTFIDNVKVIFHKYLPWSLSFASCSQKKHHIFFLKVQNWAKTKDIDFEEWFRNIKENPEYDADGNLISVDEQLKELMK